MTPTPESHPPHPPHPPHTPHTELRPLPIDTARIIVVGIGCWVVALVVTLVVPALHTGDRDWWPWACVTGLVLGLVGLLYVVRGRGNAADASHG